MRQHLVLLGRKVPRFEVNYAPAGEQGMLGYSPRSIVLCSKAAASPPHHLRQLPLLRYNAFSINFTTAVRHAYLQCAVPFPASC